MSDNDNVPPASMPQTAIQLVDHDGRLYPLHALLAQLPNHNLLLLNQEAPQSGQAAWDFVTKHWPALADCLAAGVEPVSVKP